MKPTTPPPALWADHVAHSAAVALAHKRAARLRRFRVWAHCLRFAWRIKRVTMAPMTSEEREKGLKLYLAFSCAEGGIDDRVKVSRLLHAAGQLIDSDDVDDLCQRVGYVTGTLPCESFLSMLAIRKRRYLNLQRVTDTEAAFASLADPESQEICTDRLLSLCKDFCLSSEVEHLIAETDADGSGKIDLGEFKELLDTTEPALAIMTPDARQQQLPDTSQRTRDHQQFQQFQLAQRAYEHSMRPREDRGVVHEMSASMSKRVTTERDAEAQRRSSGRFAVMPFVPEPPPPFCVPRSAYSTSLKTRTLVATERLSPRRAGSAARVPTAQAHGFGGSSRRFDGEQPLAPLPKATRTHVGPSRPHPADSGIHGRRDSQLSAPLPSKPKSARSGRRGGGASSQADTEPPPYARFNPFLGVPPPASRPGTASTTAHGSARPPSARSSRGGQTPEAEMLMSASLARGVAADNLAMVLQTRQKRPDSGRSDASGRPPRR